MQHLFKPNFLAISVFTLACSLFACEENNDQLKSQKFEEIAKKVDGHHITVSSEIMSTKITKGSSELNLIIFDNDLISEAFVLQSSNYYNMELPKETRNVVYNDKLVLIENNNNVISFALGVDKHQMDLPVDINQSFFGYGLAHQVGMKKSVEEYSEFRIASADCTSGGEGASECSLDGAFGTGGCTVKCNEGYYACCDADEVRCTCVSDEETIEDN